MPGNFGQGYVYMYICYNFFGKFNKLYVKFYASLTMLLYKAPVSSL